MKRSQRIALLLTTARVLAPLLGLGNSRALMFYYHLTSILLMSSPEINPSEQKSPFPVYPAYNHLWVMLIGRETEWVRRAHYGTLTEHLQNSSRGKPWGLIPKPCVGTTEESYQRLDLRPCQHRWEYQIPNDLSRGLLFLSIERWLS